MNRFCFVSSSQTCLLYLYRDPDQTPLAEKSGMVSSLNILGMSSQMTPSIQPPGISFAPDGHDLHARLSDASRSSLIAATPSQMFLVEVSVRSSAAGTRPLLPVPRSSHTIPGATTMNRDYPYMSLWNNNMEVRQLCHHSLSPGDQLDHALSFAIDPTRGSLMQTSTVLIPSAVW